jgi:tRNA(Arg) A34 adenosine deaminase TadA
MEGKMSDESYLREVIAMAKASVRQGGGPFAALVVLNGEVIGRGVNRVTRDNDPTAHAEVQAIRDACKSVSDFSLEGSTLYVSCEPCPMCLAAAYWARLDGLVYAASAEDAARAGFDDVLIREELQRQQQERRLSTRQALRADAQEVFELWASLEDKIEY